MPEGTDAGAEPKSSREEVPGPSAPRSRDLLSLVAGLVLLVGGAQFVVEMAVEEALWPHSWPVGAHYSGCSYPYNPLENAISDLGGYCALGYGIAFDISVFVIGVAALVAALLLWQLLPRRRSLRIGVVLLMLAGGGAMGVGIFPEYTHFWHGFFALVAFVFGGLGLIALGRGFRKTGEGPTFSLLTSLGGVVDLVSIPLFGIGLGISGFFERMIVAPVIVWAIAYGLRLLRGQSPPNTAADQEPAPK
ncbi:MAG: DUF998 domain-containing protein [Euryarchaeota archaeon]|nr:DUF998 domain-containing protein [Euryarchaeota archaeon]MDE1835283.1 DUF998 domain-containing protein [Euryarchaeota archaeon]MDE1881060.1 DUF998 domain-containing protein [Euryarchaeota archaeon]MDE2043579.1 DUF998 domain-containing protein [Thermoplasmata archaeon]